MRNIVKPVLLVVLLVVGGCAIDTSGGGGDDADKECPDGRGSSTLGGVCREDCDCASGYSCFDDDYDEQCCAHDLSDLDNGAWGIDCDGLQ